MMPSLDSLTLRERVAQMLLVGFRGCHASDCSAVLDDIRGLGVGGVILFDRDVADSSLPLRNVESPEQLRALVAALGSAARIPLLVAIDQEGGQVNRLKTSRGFPASVSHAALGGAEGVEGTREAAAVIAATLAGAGINFNLAPVVDLDTNPDNPIIRARERSFSADPDAVARHARAFVEAHRARGVMCCAKHFPGHGSAAGDTHAGFVDVTSTWNERELLPFRRVIEAAACDAVMSAHVFNATLDPVHPATLSPAVLTGLLRGQLGFEGLIVSDDMQMGAIASHYGLQDAVERAVCAGVDLLCYGNNLHFDPQIARKVVDILVRAVEEGRIPRERIDESCARLLTFKSKL
jgi:beta-N-acetylhexosaminidase